MRWCARSPRGTSRSRDPREAYQPFDVNANGYVPGEGGAVLVVEDDQAALERGAKQIHGEIAGYATTHNGYHHEEVTPNSHQLVRAVRQALADAQVTPQQVSLVMADGAGRGRQAVLPLERFGSVNQVRRGGTHTPPRRVDGWAIMRAH